LVDERQFVFGYGSLAGRTGVPAELTGHVRRFGVAMDNRVEIPGYKVYVDPQTGERPRAHVAFLDIVPEPGGTVNGLLFEVSEDELERLDRRERNYRRVEVAGAIDADVSGAVWAYCGSLDGRTRFDDGLRSGDLVVTRAYLETVESGFAALGDGQLAAYRASTAAPPCPVVDLTRVDLT
jgi:cation transport regulator ChaC